MIKIRILYIFLFCLLSFNGFAFNEDREKHVDEYIKEFVSPQFKVHYTNIYTAMVNVLKNLPSEVFNEISDRSHPIIFVNSITSGIARYANATEFTVTEGGPPTLTEGFYLIILGDELNNTDDVEAIEGVLYHEIAHRYLNHLRADKHSCEMEREANIKVKEWGFEDQYQKAKEAFGSKKTGDSPCQDLEKVKD